MKRDPAHGRRAKAGKAVPRACAVPAKCMEHIEGACRDGVHECIGDKPVQLDADVRAAVRFCAEVSVEDAQAYRCGMLARWREQALKEPLQPGLPCRVELLRSICKELDIPGADSFLDVVTAAPMVGTMGFPEIFPESAKPVDAPMELDELFSRQPEVLARVSAAIRKADPNTKQLVWESVQKEVGKDHMTRLDPEALPKNSVYFLRFILEQERQDTPLTEAKKRRPVDDGAMALINQAVAVTTPIKVDDADAFAACARELIGAVSERSPGEEFAAIALDHREAYRQVPAANDVACRVVVAEDPATGKLAFFRADRLLFGEASSVLVYNCFARLLAQVARRGLRLPVMQYYDDFACPRRASDTQVLPHLMYLWRNLLGTSFADEKTAEGPCITHLGLVFTFSGQGFTVSLSEHRRQRLSRIVTKALQDDMLLPGAASSLAGKLTFAASALYGRVGRAMLVPLYMRAKQRSVYKSGHRLGTLSAELRDALEWWVWLLGSPFASFERRVEVSLQVAVQDWHLLYTDASLTAIGAVLMRVRAGCIVSTRVLQVKVPEEGLGLFIHVYEMLAVSTALRTWCKAENVKRLMLYVDNMAVLGSIIKGKSAVPELLGGVVTELNITVWAEHVRSIYNVADLPSRFVPLFEWSKFVDMQMCPTSEVCVAW